MNKESPEELQRLLQLVLQKFAEEEGWGPSISQQIESAMSEMRTQQKQILGMLNGEGIEDKGIKGILQEHEARLNQHERWWGWALKIPAWIGGVLGAVWIGLKIFGRDVP